MRLSLTGRGLGAFAWVLVLALPAWAESEAPSQSSQGPQRLVVDRVVARFAAPEAGGHEQPHFIYERELSFEARLVALADPAFRSKGEAYRRHHLQAALERHIAEELLSSLRMTPEPPEAVIQAQRDSARVMAEEQAGGADALRQAAELEGLGRLEVMRVFRRRARASLYLDRMVTPMLEPSTLELRRAHRSKETPFSKLPFAEVEGAVRRWYVAENLKLAAQSYYQNARARLDIRFFSSGE